MPILLSDTANALLNAGQEAQAVNLVYSAVQAGDAEAIYLYALWHIYGHPVPRNFVVARDLFERAAQCGHIEAARIFSVFVGIGAGGKADWSSAVALNAFAARTDDVANREAALLAAMDLDLDGTPRQVPPIEAFSKSPRLGIVRSLFSAEECRHVVDLATPRMTPSVVVNSATGVQSPHPIRTSDNAVLGPIQQDLVMHALNVRIAAVTGTREAQGEPVSILRYNAGQQYRLHHDCLPGEENQRICTVIVYLNDGFGEGGTYFSELGQALKPMVGDALVFWNVLPNGQIDEQSRHAGLPVTHGTKWVCTRWIRQTTFDPWNMRFF